MNPNALALGCAQLGQDYGPAGGVMDYGLARDIIAAAYEGGVRRFDTAAAYGKSEHFLRKALCEIRAKDTVITTKVVSQQEAVDRRSLGWAILWHKDTWPNEMWCDGASVYEVGAAKRAIDLHMKYLQVPANVFDRRMARAGVFEKAHEAGTTVFVRSVYLRGRLLDLNDELRHQPLEYMMDDVGWDTDSRDTDVVAAFAYWYVRNMAPHATPVIGAETVEQVQENIHIANLFDGWDEAYPEDDPNVYDPRRWDE